MNKSFVELDERERRSGLIGPRAIGATRSWLAARLRLDHDGLRRAVVLGLCVFCLAYGAVALTRFNDRTASVWLANAIIVGLVLRAPRHDWTALLAVAFGANVAANLANFDTIPHAAMLALVNIVESVIVIHAMARVIGARTRFDDGHVIARFMLYAGFVGPLSAAALAAGLLALTNGIDFATTMLHWYIADALGLLTLGALLLAAQAKGETEPRRAWVVSWASVILSSAATAIAFTREAGPLMFVVAPMLMMATLRAPLTATMVALVGSVAIAIATTAMGIGPIASAEVDPATQLYLLQGFIASLLFVVLPVRALIGERERLGGVIARSERMFARMAEASPAGTIHFDPHGRPTYANQRWSDLTGLDHEALENDCWLDAIDPADRSAAKSLWSRARATLVPCSEEYRFVELGRPAGYAELHFTPEVEDGRVLGFVARLTDVTDQRRAQDALSEREARYRLVTENAQDVIVRLGLDGCPIYVSNAALRVTGYAPAELVGRPLSERIHPADLAVFAHTLARLAKGTADPAIEFRLRHRDGHYRWFESSQRPLFDADGAPTEMIASLRDIDLRRRSEFVASEVSAKMRESNRLLLLAEELAGVGHWQFDPANGEFDYSPQIDRFLQRDRADRMRATNLLGIVHRDDRRALLACLARARRTPGSTDCALRVLGKAGQRHLQLAAQADYSGAQFVGWVGVARDVTDQVVAEAALVAARDEARAATQAKSHFIATMSHEIRTPMTGVLGMIELLRDTPAPRERDRYFGALEQSAGLLMAVLNDVLDFSKIDSGTLQLEQTSFDLDKLVRTTLDLYGNAASRKGLPVSFETNCAVPAMVLGDPVRLQQILSNLLCNAVKFTERGHITLRLDRDAAGDATRYQFAVTDTGIGLEPGQIDTLFEPFVQADVSTSRRYGGTGLGLSISRRLVEAMGGNLDVVSRFGEGSTFTFDLTLAPGHAGDAGVADGLVAPVIAGPLDVLVAEDNPVNQMLVAALVRRMGHRVTVVANGREAVEAATTGRFDAILMDMQMPELDGLAATRAIRASGTSCASIPILALTADASPERRRFYDGAGLTAFLTKPVDPRALSVQLALVTPASAPSLLSGAPTEAAVDDTSPAMLDRCRIDELQSALGSARLDALLALLIVECRERPRQLRAAHRRGDLDALRAEAHSITGAASSIGAAALCHAARRIEQASGLASAEYLIRALATTAAATRVEAERLLGHLPDDRAIA